MKISIDIELDPSEVPLATELIATIRSLTDHVKGPPPAVHVTTAAPVISAPPPASLSALASQASSGSTTPQQQPVIASKPVEPIASLPINGHSVPAPIPSAKSGPAAPPTAAPPVISAGAEPTLFEKLQQRLALLDDPSKIDQVTADIVRLLQPYVNNHSEAVAAFMAAFNSVVLIEEIVLNEKSVFPYFQLLPNLPEPWKTQVRDALIPMVLKQLTQKRSIDCNRVDFFAHTEAFAALVNIDFVSVGGAIQTITTLLKKPETRSAAVTMLGKTVEMCLPQLISKCPAETLANLRTELRGVKEEQFQYDLEYVNDMMGWASRQGILSPIASFSGGHSSMIFGLYWHQNSNQLISSGKDGHIVVWSNLGQVVTTKSIDNFFTSAMDVHLKYDLLLCASMDTQATKPPIVSAFDINRNFANVGQITRHQNKIISSLKTMPLSDHVLMGESVTVPGQTALSEVINVYDLSRMGSGFGNLEPIRSLGGHSNVVTCIAASTLDPNMLFTGSKDKSVMVWDVRMDDPVGKLGASVGGSLVAHTHWVSGIDTVDYTVATASADNTCKVWDMRQMHTGGLLHTVNFSADDKHVMKVALGERGMFGAASTLLRLYHIDWATGSVVINPAKTPDNSVAQGSYYGLQWAHSQERQYSLLYAAGKGGTIDVYDAR